MIVPDIIVPAVTGMILSGALATEATDTIRAPSHRANTLAEELTDKLDSVLVHALAEQRIVGAVVLVAQRGELIYERAIGQADREAGRALHTDDIFRLASLTKPIISAAALALAEQGRLRLDDPVGKWLPWFRPTLDDGTEATILVRHLLTHTAGLGYGFFQSDGGPYATAGVSDGLDHPRITLEENLRRLATVPLFYEPGTAWGYSLATDLLGAVLEKAGGAPLPKLVESLVTGPLGMRDTHFHARDVNRLVTPYADGDPVPVRMGALQIVPFNGAEVRFAPGRALDPEAYPSGGAGMVGSARDFLTFLEALRTGGAPILSLATIAAMTRNQTGELFALQNGPGTGFGLGFALVEDSAAAGTPQSPGTFWWGGAYGHSWWVDPARGLSVVVLTNTAMEGLSGAFPVAVRAAVYGALQ
jgi:CubicO group peptidase (beta-lactamase class C family)